MEINNTKNKNYELGFTIKTSHNYQTNKKFK
jgi:hypothetical protein